MTHAIDCKVLTSARIAPARSDGSKKRLLAGYRCPVKARMIRIKRINPSPPLGQYPQPELYGHAGSAPIKSRIRMINRIVPMVSPFLNYVRQRQLFWTLQSPAPDYVEF